MGELLDGDATRPEPPGETVGMPMHDRMVIKTILDHFGEVAQGLAEVRGVYEELRGRRRAQKPIR